MSSGASVRGGKSLRLAVTIAFPAAQRRGDDVPVVGAGQVEVIGQALVAGDEAIPDGAVHERARPRQLVHGQLGPAGEDRAEGLVEDAVGLAGANHAGHGEADEQIALGRGKSTQAS